MEFENLSKCVNVVKLSETKALELADKTAANMCKADTREEFKANAADKIYYLMKNDYITFFDSCRLAVDLACVLDKIEPPSEKDISDCIMQYLKIDDGECDTLYEYSLSDIVNSLKDIKELLIDIRNGLKWLRAEG